MRRRESILQRRRFLGALVAGSLATLAATLLAPLRRYLVPPTPEPEAVEADEQWYYSISGEQVGPVSQELLKQRIRDGEIPHGTLLWRDGLSGWTPIEQTVFSQYCCKTVPPPLPPLTPSDSDSPPSVVSPQAGSTVASTPTGDDAVRCAVCGSSSVDYDKTKWKTGRAVAGLIFLGPLGAITGFSGDKRITFTCLKCGNKWRPGDQEGMDYHSPILALCSRYSTIHALHVAGKVPPKKLSAARSLVPNGETVIAVLGFAGIQRNNGLVIGQNGIHYSGLAGSFSHSWGEFKECSITLGREALIKTAMVDGIAITHSGEKGYKLLKELQKLG